MRAAALSTVVAIATLAGAARLARADEVVTYHADGAAPATSADDKAGRTVALDAAFQDATKSALAELASADALAAKADQVDAEIVKRARLWVASFKVTRQAFASGSLTVSVDVRIDAGKLRARLVELGVATDAAPSAPSGPRPAMLLLHVTTVEGVLATYGTGASNHVPGAEPALAALAHRGLTMIPPSTSGAAAGDDLSDEAARGYAGDGHAALVLIAGVVQGAPGAVRGVRGIAGVSRAQVRLVDVVTGTPIGEAQAARGAIGAAGDGAADVSRAATRDALLEAMAAAFPPPTKTPPAAATGPALALPAAGQGEVIVRVRGASGAQVASLRTYLAGAQGVKGVSLRRLAAGEVVLAVRGVRAEHVSALFRADTDLALRVRVDGDAVEVAVSAP